MISSVFGVPIMIDDAAHQTEIIDYLLNPADPDEAFHIPDDYMIEFLSAVSKLEVEMDPEADEMLKDYFAATRSIRESEKKLLNFRFFNDEILFQIR